MTPRRALLGFAVASGITLSYMAVRAALKELVLPDADWVTLDWVQNVPRLASFTAALYLGWRLMGRVTLGLHARGALAGLLAGAALMALWVGDHLLRTHPYALGPDGWAQLTIGSLIVALNEETLFRGLMFQSLRVRYGAEAAVWGSTLLFTVFHYGAQPLRVWPSIFATGLIYASLARRGVGLGWLVLTHALIDSLIFLGGSGPHTSGMITLGVIAAKFVLAAGVYVWSRRP